MSEIAGRKVLMMIIIAPIIIIIIIVVFQSKKERISLGCQLPIDVLK